MESRVIGLVAAIGAAAPLASAQAAVAPEEATNALRVSSVAELLDATPNAAAILAALDAERKSGAAVADKGVEMAQWHHHHHHHHWYYHHHHHHHHDWYWHHHHHHWYWRHHHHHHYWGY